MTDTRMGDTVAHRVALKLVIRDYVDSLVRDGFRRIVFLPMRGAHLPGKQPATRRDSNAPSLCRTIRGSIVSVSRNGSGST
jgi:hypothetical protein